jgi:hypothetical protein
LKITINTAEAKDLCNKIPKFSGQKEEIQLEEFVRQIENFADLVQWVDNEDGENEMEPFVTSSEDCLPEKQTKFGD